MSKDYVALIKGLRKVMRGFEASDGYDLRKPSSLSGGRKSAVSRASDYVDKLKRRGSGEYSTVRLRGSRKRITRVLDSAQQSNYRTRAKVAFIPAAGVAKADREGNVTMTASGLSRTVVLIPASELAMDAELAIKAAVKRRADYYGIVAGEHEILIAETHNNIDTLIGRVLFLQHQYSAAGGKNWENWLHGVVLYTATKRAFKNEQEKIKKYRAFKKRWRARS